MTNIWWLKLSTMGVRISDGKMTNTLSWFLLAYPYFAYKLIIISYHLLYVTGLVVIYRNDLTFRRLTYLPFSDPYICFKAMIGSFCYPLTNIRCVTFICRTQHNTFPIVGEALLFDNVTVNRLMNCRYNFFLNPP